MPNPIYPFTVLRYSPTVSTWQIGQSVLIQPSPGSTAISYTVSSGTLPAGLFLASSTGLITGIPTTLTPASEILITATLPDTTTRQVTIFITISDVPVIAPDANQTSATDLAVLMNQAQEIFIDSATQLISNANQLGQFHIYMDIIGFAPLCSLRTYFQNLGYVFQIVTVENNNNQFTSPSGEFFWWPSSPYGFFFYNSQTASFGPFGPNFYGAYGGPQQVFVQPRVLISWQSTPVFPSWPYYPYSQ